MPTMNDVFIAVCRFQHFRPPQTQLPEFEKEYQSRQRRLNSCVHREQGQVLSPGKCLPSDIVLGPDSCQAFSELRELLTPGTAPWKTFTKSAAA